MILSALLTSVGINLGLCFLFFTLYSILRKQPNNVKVYAPRLVAEGKIQERGHFNLERLVPSTGWVTTAWQTSEDEMLSKLGLDAVVLMRIFIFSMKVFSFATAVGICILVPVNYLGSQLDIDFSGLPQKSIDSFSISNVNDGSKRLWIHFCAAYIFTGVICFFLYSEYNYVSCKRIEYFYSSKPQPHHFTVLVRGIPAPSIGSYSDAVESFFTEYHPTTYLSHSLVRRSNKLQRLMNDAENMYKKVLKIKAKSDCRERYKRSGFLGLWGPRVNLVDHYGKKLEDLECAARIEQTSVTEKAAAFVCFKSRYGAAIALHIQQGVNPTEWTTEKAPEPEDIHWPFFSASFMKRWICQLTVIVTCALITLLFLVPVVLVQGLTHLEQLEKWFPFLKSVLQITVISQVITGYLPSLILQTFLSFVPPVMILLSAFQGYISRSQIEKSACAKMLWFTVWNIFFANVLSGSVLTMANIFLEPKKIPSILAALVPAQASFFIAYVVTSGWTSISSELFRSTPLICNYLKTIFRCKEDDGDFEVPSIPYYSEVPKLTFFGLLGVVYFFLAPLILPFLLIYYFMGYIIFRNQLLNVYKPKYETGGKFWPIVHNATIFSLVLMQVIAIGIFGLKMLPLASGLTIPLPILTLLFNEYCRKRFLPIFHSYPAECLIKKDRHDLNEAMTREFLERLKTVYRDPTSLPVRYTDNLERPHSPLLTTDVRTT
uniref:CSC1-like protein HYP1 n=1 Tax=Kalanchoe fedtschenkoi TaxID=63787 RepID=A0A7N1A408_KALFE